MVASLIHKENSQHPSLSRKRLTHGQKAADKVTRWVGSWLFIVLALVFIGIWMSLNIYLIFFNWDPYPFILLNFVLSCLAALQAPIILMSQNRGAERDRVQAKYDYEVNRKAEREIQDLQKDVEEIKMMLVSLGAKRVSRKKR